MFRRQLVIIAGSLLLAVLGCGGPADDSAVTTDKSPVAEPSAPATLNAAPKSTSSGTPQPAGDKPSAAVGTSSTSGSLHGIVTFQGALPAPRVIQATKDPEVCSAGEGEVQHVVVKDGRLAGAIMELSVKGDDLPEFKSPENGFVIRQKDCRFSPRLLVAYSGAELVVYNDDRVSHNVNTGAWNLLQAPGSEPIREPITFGGNSFTRVTCNIHNWMETWVYVARSPFYAVSDDKGEFLIEGIPPGTRIRGVLTHATLGKQRVFVDVEAGKTTEKNFVFEGE